MAGQWVKVGVIERAYSVTLDANGKGYITIAVGSANEKWELDGITVTTSQRITQQPYPDVNGYEGGSEVLGQRSFGSTFGFKNMFSGRFTIDAGNDFLIRFGGGIPGTIATAKAAGERYRWV